MPFLIDGHNLIPHIGLRLDSLDDELELIRLLQEYCRLSRSQAEAYFDNAPAGQPAKQKHGAVTAHSVRRPDIADEAIRRRIKDWAPPPKTGLSSPRTGACRRKRDPPKPKSFPQTNSPGR